MIVVAIVVGRTKRGTRRNADRDIVLKHAG